MKALYEVTAIKNRPLKGAAGYFTADEGYVVHKSYQVASSQAEAIDLVKSYHILPGTKFDSIRATFIETSK